MPKVYYDLMNWLEGTYTLRILEGFFDLLFRFAPFMVASVIISVAATRFFLSRTTPLLSTRNEFLAVAMAAAGGLVSPLPTYAAIPVGLSLMPSGVPFSAVLAFAIASPLMNPSVFFLTATRLGMGMALARTVTAFLAGAVAGSLVMTLFRSFQREANVRAPRLPPGERTLREDVWRTSLYTGKVFCIAILISSAVKACVPAQVIVDLLGEHAAYGTLVAIGLGVPFYSCGGAAIPLVETLMGLGMGKGATLAFFIAGPATKVETIYAFKKMMGGKVLLFYLALTFTLACVAGGVYSMF